MEQAAANIRAAELPPLTRQQMEGVKRIYDKRIKPLVHQLW